MNDDLWGQIIIAITAVLGSILGYALAGLNDARRDQRAVIREQEARLEERKMAALREQRDFQLATLLELQDALQLMARLTGRALHFDHMQARRGEYTQFPAHYSDEMHTNGVDVTRLRNRLLDDSLRTRIERFQEECAKASMLPTRYKGLEGDQLEAEALGLLTTFGSQVSILMDYLGTVLRRELAHDLSHG
ncbi:hypothetical protein FRIG_03670 [Frigoribacterium faeni]|uniref:hypothetical protein n=1 Tax=Frigoribacterium faeni TaxID=145483 RepID=UPI001FAE5DA4|nr:hypothetical protein [Frigoribacterium faeni]MCJ0700239.1 hypothetical protein [Frigoribacterium faeni]